MFSSQISQKSSHHRFIKSRRLLSHRFSTRGFSKNPQLADFLKWPVANFVGQTLAWCAQTLKYGARNENYELSLGPPAQPVSSWRIRREIGRIGMAIRANTAYTMPIRQAENPHGVTRAENPYGLMCFADSDNRI
jgi:hypothetical protein